MKYLAFGLSLFLVGASVVGCGSKRKTTYVESAAPVVTYSVTFVDTFSDEDRQELINSVAAIFSQALASVQPTVVNNITNDIDVTITITKNKVGPVINHSHNNILTECGDRGHRLPHLFEQLCKKFKHKKDRD